jgi:hypothetical protein
MPDAPDRGPEILRRIFGIQPYFDGMAAALNFVLAQRQRFAGGDSQLPFDEVEAGDHFGDRVLDLQACIHLDEEHAAVRRDHEFDSAGTAVADRTGGCDRAAIERVTLRVRQAHGGRFLDHLLVASLQGAVALVQVNDIAVIVAEHLDFDMPGRFHVLLEQHRRIAEGGARFALR